MRRFTGLVLVAAMVGGAACSGDDDDDGQATTTGDSAPTTSPHASSPPATAAPDTTALEPATTFTFGMLAPGDDVLDELAGGQERALAMALDDINADGGVLGGDVTSVVIEESVDEPLEASLESLTTAGADAIVGPVSSASAVQVAPLARDQGLLVCSASATAASVTHDGSADAFFRTAMRDDDTAVAVADQIMDVDDEREPPQRIAVLGRDDVHGTELAGVLSAQLTVRGATVDTNLYPARRVDFDDEAEFIVAADPDVVVLASFGEGITLLQQLIDAGFPLDRVVGLDGLSRTDLVEQVAPDDASTVDGLRIVRTTGDRLLTERLMAGPGSGDRTLYGAQMYDCAITIALAAIAADSTAPADIGAEVRTVTSGGRTCSTFAHCRSLLDVGQDIAYTGASGGIEIDAAGDISTTRLTTSVVVDGALEELTSTDIDLIAERREQLLASAVVMTQVQQMLKVLGYFDGDVTGFHDDETEAALRALQRDLEVAETGAFDEATDVALRSRLGTAADTLDLAVRQLQVELQALGYYDGPIDGRFSAATVAAVRAFQTRIGVPPTGLLDAATLRQIHVLGQQNPLQPPPAVPPLDPPSTTVPAPAPPATTPPVTTRPVVTPTTAAPPAPTVTTSPPAPTVTAPPTTMPPTTTTAPAPPAPELPTMYAALGTDDRFTTFVGLIRTAGFAGDLDAPIPAFTVFAPTNAAFEAMDPDELDQWTEDPVRLRAMLAFHAVDPDEGVLGPGDLRPGALRSIHGAALDIVDDGAGVTVGGARPGAPLGASNGIIHPLDTVLLPPA